MLLQPFKLNPVQSFGALELECKSGPTPGRYLLGKSQRIPSFLLPQDLHHQLVSFHILVFLHLAFLHHLRIGNHSPLEGLEHQIARQDQRFLTHTSLVDLDGLTSNHCRIFRLVDGTLAKISGKPLDYEEGVLLLAMHGTHFTVSGFD